MTRSMLAVVVLVAGLALAMSQLAQAQEKAAPNVTGTWKWTTQRGGNEMTTTAKLKQEGDKVTGTVSARNQDTEISDGKIKDGEVSFKVKRTFNDQEIIMVYTGKVDGDTIKGKITREGAADAQPRDWEAKRVKEETKTEEKKG